MPSNNGDTKIILAFCVKAPCYNGHLNSSTFGGFTAVSDIELASGRRVLASRVHLGADVVARVVLLARAVDPRWLHSFGLPSRPVGTGVADLVLVT